jgi:hypothetical protein
MLVKSILEEVELRVEDAVTAAYASLMFLNGTSAVAWVGVPKGFGRIVSLKTCIIREICTFSPAFGF